MEENLYVLEQQIRDRLAEARAAARIWSLTHELVPRAPGPHYVLSRISGLANWMASLVTRLRRQVSRTFRDVRATTTHGERARRETRPAMLEVQTGRRRQDEALGAASNAN